MIEAGSHLAIVFAAAAIVCAALLWLLLPLLSRYALARPNARSSHRTPAPQGGGIAVIGAITLVLAGTAFFAPALPADPFGIAIIFACVIGLAVLGATDDLKPLEALPRLLFQAMAVGVVIAMLPAELRVFTVLPWWIERALMCVSVLWFVNVTNFMDGIDWMTVAEVVPVTAALAWFGAIGALPSEATLVALALCGAMVGFAPFNRPVAKVFLGDVGSLPIGLLLSWLLLLLAANGHVAAALLLPLYYVADATITLLLRLARGERVTQAHRSHFYQRALDGGMSVTRIVGSVFLLNLLLIGLAAATMLFSSQLAHAVLLGAGCVLTGLLLYRFAQAKP